MNIIGYYKNWCLVERGNKYAVVNRPDKKVVFTSTDEESATKVFVMLLAEFINEKGEVQV